MAAEGDIAANREFITSYAVEFASGMAKNNSSLYKALGADAKAISDAIINYKTTGGAPLGMNLNALSQVIKRFDSIVNDTATRLMNMRSRVYGTATKTDLKTDVRSDRMVVLNTEGVETNGNVTGREVYQNADASSSIQAGTEENGVYNRMSEIGNSESGKSAPDRGNGRNVEERAIEVLAEDRKFIKLRQFVGNELSEQQWRKIFADYENDTRLSDGYDPVELATYDMLTNPSNELRELFSDNIAEYFLSQRTNAEGVETNGNDERSSIYQNDNGYSKLQTGAEEDGVYNRSLENGAEQYRETSSVRRRHGTIETRTIEVLAKDRKFINLRKFVGNEMPLSKLDVLWEFYAEDARLLDEGYDLSEVITYDMLTNPDNELRALFADNIAEYFGEGGQNTDIAGNAVSNETAQKLSGSVVKNESGQLIPVYHSTDKPYAVLKAGDIGIHFGSYAQAVKRANDKGIDKPTYIKAYLNITNPLVIDDDFYGWNAAQIAQGFAKRGIITNDEAVDFVKNRADAQAQNQKLVDMLKAKGYDGVIYTNDKEATQGKSYIVFDDSQIVRTEDSQKAEPLVTLRHNNDITSVFDGATRLLCNDYIITDGSVVIPYNTEVLDRIKKATRLRAKQSTLGKIDKIYKGGSTQIVGEPKLSTGSMGSDTVSTYVFEIDGKYFMCQQKYLDYFNDGENTIYASANDERIPWSVRGKNGELKALFMGMKTDRVTSDTYAEMQSVNEASGSEMSADAGVRYSFAGINSKIGDVKTLSEAKALKENGLSNEEIFAETGWFIGQDGKWKFEIDDSEAVFYTNSKLATKGNNEYGFYKTGSLSDVLYHDELYKAYPFLENYTVIIQETESGVQGITFPKDKQIVLSDILFLNKKPNPDKKARIKEIEATSEYKEYNKFYDDDAYSNLAPDEWLKLEEEARNKFFSSEIGKEYYDLNWGNSGYVTTFELTENGKKVLMHEIQHVIQAYEGFESGSNPEYWKRKGGVDDRTAGELYENTAGEIEARDVSDRISMTAEERRNTFPESAKPNKSVVFNRSEVSFDLANDFGIQLDDWLQGGGKKNGIYNGKYFELGTTPNVLVKYGARRLPVIMPESCLLKITGGKHSISLDELKKLPQQLNNPIMLFKGSVKNSFVALTEMKMKNGHNAVVAIHLNKTVDRYNINKIASIHSRTTDGGKDVTDNYVQNNISAGNLVYASQKKAPIWFTSRGLQLPKLVQTKLDASFDNNVSHNDSIVNNSIRKNGENDTTKTSIESEGIENGGGNLLLRDSRRTGNASAGEQTVGIQENERQVKERAYSERKEQAKEFRRKGQTEVRVVDKTQINLVKTEAYTSEMQAMVDEYAKQGVKLHFFIGDGRLAFDSGRSFLANGISDGQGSMYVKYDSVVSPKKLALHELVHTKWKTLEMQQLRDKILNSLTAEEKAQILRADRYKHYMEVYNGNAELVWEEFVADTFAGMNDYTARFTTEVQEATYNEADIDRFTPAEYTESIDAGGVLNEKTGTVSGGVSRLSKVSRNQTRGDNSNYPNLQNASVILADKKGNGALNSGRNESKRSGEVGMADGVESAENTQASGRESANERRYINAVNSGNMEIASRIVEQEAESKGFLPVHLYHGTHSESGFVEFKGKAAYWVTPSENYAESYTFTYIENPDDIAQSLFTEHGSAIYDLYAKIERPLNVGNIERVIETPADLDSFAKEIGFTPQEIYKCWNAGREHEYDTIWSMTITPEFAEIARNRGYDALKALEKNGIPTYGILYAENLKSAKPVTYDSDGNIVPVSERFNTQRTDIRYSLDDNGIFDLIDVWNGKLEEFGVIPKGEKPVRDVEVPKKIAKDKPVSQFARTMMEAGVTPDESISEFEKLVLDGTMTHEVITNKQAQAVSWI